MRPIPVLQSVTALFLIVVVNGCGVDPIAQTIRDQPSGEDMDPMLDEDLGNSDTQDLGTSPWTAPDMARAVNSDMARTVVLDMASTGNSDMASTGSPDLASGAGDMAPGPSSILRYDGVYDVSSTLDFAKYRVVPGSAADAIAALAELRDNPGKALIDAAKATYTPNVTDVLNYLTEWQIQTILIPAINDAFRITSSSRRGTIQQDLAAIHSAINGAFQTLQARETMTVRPPSASGAVQIEQQFTELGYNVSGRWLFAPIPTSQRAAAFSRTSGTLVPHTNPFVADADLTLAAASYTLPVGSLLLKATGSTIFSPYYGADNLTVALQLIIQVSAQQLENAIMRSPGIYDLLINPWFFARFFSEAPRLVADRITAQINAVKIGAAPVSNGHGVLFDYSPSTPPDRRADRIDLGTWTWGVPVGTRRVNIDATFSGRRTGEVP